MSDKIFTDSGGAEKLVDLGDGSFARRVALVDLATAAGGGDCVDLSYGTDYNASGSSSGSFNVTLNYVTGKTLYVTGVVIVAAAAASAQTVFATLNGILGGNNQVPIAVSYPASGYAMTMLQFNRPVPASAPGSSVYLSLPGPTGIAAQVFLQGFYK